MGIKVMEECKGRKEGITTGVAGRGSGGNRWEYVVREGRKIWKGELEEGKGEIRERKES